MSEKPLDTPVVEKPAPTSSAGIDFSKVKALANNDYQVEPWYKSFFGGLAEGIIKALLFLLGFLLDVLKTLWTVISGIFIYAYRGVRGIIRYFIRMARIFKEVDGSGKLSFLLQGFGNIKYGQVVTGIIFMAVEIAFIVFMVLNGGASISHIFKLDYLRKKSHQTLILAIMAIIIVVAYFVVYNKGIQSMYDCYQIKHELEFRKARENALDVIAKTGEFDEDLTKLSRGKIFRLMRDKYGYDILSARYISYVDFKRLPEKKDNAFYRCSDAIKNKIYAGYTNWANKVKAGKWSSVFADWLNWELVKRQRTTGYDVIKNELEVQLLAFRHTYDKYNDYHSVIRDSEAMLRCLKDPQGLIDAVFADDEVSKRNGIAPIAHNVYQKPKQILSRVVGKFEVSLPVGQRLSKILADIIKAIPDDEGRIAAINDACAKEQAFHDSFIQTNKVEFIASAEGMQKCLRSYKELASVFDGGKKAFLAHIKANYGVVDFHANMVFNAYAAARKQHHNEEEIVAYLEQAAVRQEPLKQLIQDYAFHGQVLVFKKQAKQYLDEKFAVTILALPTLGALLTCVLPLIFSIAIGFTNWDSLHTNYTFNWNLDAWKSLLGMGGDNGSDFAMTFLILLRWTIVWAFLATFSNYIMGIVLALMINKKGIKLKGLWRTCFVITIAIPQFITLLVIKLLFDKDGAINEFLMENMGFKIPFLQNIDGGVAGGAAFVLDDNATFIKFFIVIINMWIGIPYTMLSTSGILMNIPGDLYESAQIDGANSWTQFWKITMPYIIFVTGPSLLTTFIGNINNFNVIYFLTGGTPNGQVGEALYTYHAGHTDLLITWLYKLSLNEFEYSLGSVIGIMMFLVCAFFSLIMYRRMGSVKNEEAFQ